MAILTIDFINANALEMDKSSNIRALFLILKYLHILLSLNNLFLPMILSRSTIL